MYLLSLVGLRHTMEDAMVLEAGDPVDAAKVDEEDMVSFKAVTVHLLIHFGTFLLFLLKFPNFLPSSLT